MRRIWKLNKQGETIGTITFAGPPGAGELEFTGAGRAFCLERRNLSLHTRWGIVDGRRELVVAAWVEYITSTSPGDYEIEASGDDIPEDPDFRDDVLY